MQTPDTDQTGTVSNSTGQPLTDTDAGAAERLLTEAREAWEAARDWYADQHARRAAALIHRIWPDAVSLVFSADRYDDGGHEVVLHAVDAAAETLWQVSHNIGGALEIHTEATVTGHLTTILEVCGKGFFDRSRIRDAPYLLDLTCYSTTQEQTGLRNRLMLGAGDAEKVVTRRATHGPLTAVMFIADEPGQRVQGWNGSASISLTVDPDGNWRVCVNNQVGAQYAAAAGVLKPATKPTGTTS